MLIFTISCIFICIFLLCREVNEKRKLTEAKNNFYKYNTIASSAQVDVSDDGNYYSCEVKLTDTTNSGSEKIEVNFIVILGEGTDFTIGIMN